MYIYTFTAIATDWMHCKYFIHTLYNLIFVHETMQVVANVWKSENFSRALYFGKEFTVFLNMAHGFFK